VFQAHEADAARDVAVKLFRLDLPPERAHGLVAQFDRLIAAGLAHPSLVSPVASGLSGTEAYLVEELVPGDSLDVVLRAGAIRSPADALRIVTQIAAALDVAAARGFFHGALHPRDVLNPLGDSARVTGVGVAQALESVLATVPVRRPYAAPERVSGMKWDSRADVFSLAALAHEMLWSRRPAAVGEQAAATLDEVDGASLEALRRVFAQGLAPSPGDRLGTCSGFTAALGGCFGSAGQAAARNSSAARRRTPIEIKDVAERVAPSSEEPRLPLEDSVPVRSASAPVPAIVTSPASARPTPPAAPVATRVIRDRSPEPTLAPVRLDVGRPGEEPRAVRRYTGAAPDLFGTPERPAPRTITVGQDPSRSAFLSLALTAIVFVSVGFAAGYWVASWGQPSMGVTTSAAPVNAASAIEAAVPSPALPAARAPSPVEAPPPPAVADMGAPPAAPPAAAPSEQPAAEAPVRRAASTRPAAPAPARPGVLQVESRPAGANVYVDGRLRGKTPLQLDGVAIGDHGVRLQLDGYREWLAAVQVASGGRHRVAASLEPRN
jgi:hypothetical protein